MTLAPDFATRNQHGQPVGLADLRGRPAVVVFYPWAFSDICTGELSSLREAAGEFEAAGARIVAISCDAMFTLRAYADDRGAAVRPAHRPLAARRDRPRVRGVRRGGRVRRCAARSCWTPTAGSPGVWSTRSARRATSPPIWRPSSRSDCPYGSLSSRIRPDVVSRHVAAGAAGIRVHRHVARQMAANDNRGLREARAPAGVGAAFRAESDLRRSRRQKVGAEGLEPPATCL